MPGSQASQQSATKPLGKSKFLANLADKFWLTCDGRIIKRAQSRVL